MKKILTTIGVAALVVSSSACTPNQVSYWLQRHLEVIATPDPTDDIQLQAAFDSIPPTPDTACNEWFWWAIEAGWTMEQWTGFVSYVMPRESGCDPRAHNPSGATGLLQIMPMWADDCGGVPADLYDPMFNLRCGKHVFNVQGRGAWSTWGG